jgi:predicted Zn-dependent protease with MMP-like domain
MKLSHREFDAVIKQAVDGLPDPIRAKLQNTVFVVQDDMTAAQREEWGEDLLGLYQGVPYPDRGSGDPVFPDRITLFKNPIEAEAEDREHLIEIIQDTVLHEIGHSLGLDDDELDEMGL